MKSHNTVSFIPSFLIVGAGDTAVSWLKREILREVPREEDGREERDCDNILSSFSLLLEQGKQPVG